MSTVEVDGRRWYDANCHCSRVRLRLRIAPLDETGPNDPLKVVNCNCSICTKNGYLGLYPDDPIKDVEWVSGKDDLKAYSFATKAAEHMFCPTCGSSIVWFVDAAKLEEGGRWEIGVNARMIKDVEIDKLTLRKVDRANFGPAYSV